MAIDVESLYRRYGPMVVRRCRQMLGDEDRALDATQEVFMRLLKNQNQLTEEAPSGLLLQTATWVCLKVIRGEQRRRESKDESALERIAAWDPGESSVVARLHLDRIFRDERRSTRVMAVMHWIDGMTYDEIAREFRMSANGVRKRLRVLREHAVQECPQ